MIQSIDGAAVLCWSTRCSIEMNANEIKIDTCDDEERKQGKKGGKKTKGETQKEIRSMKGGG